MVPETKSKIKIGTVRERVEITPEGGFNTKLEIPYSIGDANYSVMIDKEGSTPESIEEAVREDAKKYIASKDKILTI